MINYTSRLTLLMRDIVSRVPALSFIDMDDILVFARFGRLHTDGAFATCHCLSLPPSDPGYYFWRDRSTGAITRRSEWFITKSPLVTVDGRAMKYLISFALPRFCDQSLDGSRKERFYRRASDAWIAKLDTVVHELYHIDPRAERHPQDRAGRWHLRGALPRPAVLRAGRANGLAVSRHAPDPGAYDFLQQDFATLDARHAGVIGTSFKTFPSYPQRFIERLPTQPACDVSLANIEVEPWRTGRRRDSYTEADLHVRQFLLHASRRFRVKSDSRAA